MRRSGITFISFMLIVSMGFASCHVPGKSGSDDDMNSSEASSDTTGLSGDTDADTKESETTETVTTFETSPVALLKLLLKPQQQRLL